jgi:hypothetical protein
MLNWKRFLRQMGEIKFVRSSPACRRQGVRSLEYLSSKNSGPMTPNYLEKFPKPFHSKFYSTMTMQGICQTMVSPTDDMDLFGGIEI